MLINGKDKCLLKNPDFFYDEACLNIYSNTNIQLFAQYSECENCVLQKWETSKSYLVNTKYFINLHVLFDNHQWCNKSYKFFEYGRYNWNITNNSCPEVYIKNAGITCYIPILVLIFVIFGLYIFGLMTKYLYNFTIKDRPNILNYFRRERRLNNLDEEPPPPPQIAEHNTRLKSIDTFRGFCILFMIFINYGGGQYWFFKYATWDGLQIGDLLITWFLWIMGFCIPISIHKRVQKEIPWQKTAFDIMYRTVVLVILGLIINFYENGCSFYNMRIPGYLQRLGILYFSVGIMEIIFIKRTYEFKSFSGYQYYIRDLIVSLPQWIIVLIIVILHTCIAWHLPVPGCPVGYLGPGGLHSYSMYKNCTGGAAGYIDHIIFGKYHLQNNSYAHIIYEINEPFDPTGILGYLTGILIVYLGVQAGRIYINYNKMNEKICRWITWAILTGLLGGILSNSIIPINSSLLSLSLVLVASCSATLIECGLHVFIDKMKTYSGKPHIYPGNNSIILYVGHKLFKNTFPFSWRVRQTHLEHLTKNVWAAFLWLMISVYLYNKKIPFKI